MFKDAPAYSGFAGPDTAALKEFYSGTLGLEVTDSNGMLSLHLGTGATVLVYPKEDHVPAAYTVLNFPVADIRAAVDELTARGIEFLRYPGFEQDDNGIVWPPDGPPPIAWFTDPAGNIIAVLQESPLP